MMVNDIKVGDTITFKCSSGRDSSYFRKATRKVTEVLPGCNMVTVTKFVGWENFYVRGSEILEHKKGA
ncbi:MAG: hypothetical protein A4E60_00176 [Syntrophorhabdus sp. PtaB.Bin047]|jgi:hypothetical protein|nr:MAG: hypothetical protein A4E60_00176 [Syntrophorhabdus sp. PtaB.Bin047]